MTVHTSPYRLNEILYSVKSVDVSSWSVSDVEATSARMGRRASGALKDGGRGEEKDRRDEVNETITVKQVRVYYVWGARLGMSEATIRTPYLT